MNNNYWSITEEFKKFENNFCELLDLETEYLSSSNTNKNDYEEKFADYANRLFNEFDYKKELTGTGSIQYLLEIFHSEFADESDPFDDQNEYIMFMINNTVNNIISQDRNKPLSDTVRLYFIINIGLQFKAFDEKMLEENAAKIIIAADTKYMVPMVNWDFYCRFYPNLAKQEITNATRIAVEMYSSKLADFIFND